MSEKAKLITSVFVADKGSQDEAHHLYHHHIDYPLCSLEINDDGSSERHQGIAFIGVSAYVVLWYLIAAMVTVIESYAEIRCLIRDENFLYKSLWIADTTK